jgi:two-component sensor histidine kinase
LAVVAFSTSPLVLLDGDLNVIAASLSFGRAFGIDAASAPGRFLLDLGDGEWNVPQLRSLLKATASGDAAIEEYEMDLKRAGEPHRRLVLNAQKLEYGDDDQVRLLLAIADVTDARASEKLRDDLMREKVVLLQELQHRVANSLQIIASVIMQTARKAHSDEARATLHDAHNRVMSVATLQQQLAASGLGQVALAAYFVKLCDSIGASMIRDANQITLDVAADDSMVEADVSVSLGLIITELVINSLKHAFPGKRRGKILVSYASHGPNWTLAIHDNGVGMPKDAGSSKPGLGTSIVQALAAQLNCRVQVSDGRPGTTVSVIHTQIAAVADDEPTDQAV